MDDDFFAGHFKLDVNVQGDRSRQVSYTSDPRRGIRNKRTVTIWNRGRFLADNVYLERTGSGEVRVIKQVLREKSSASLKRCLTELHAMGRLSKENALFVQFHGWFESSSHFYFAMEYLPLGDVAHCFPDPLSEAATRAIGRQVIEGLSRLHEIKIIHRDIKPQNILVQQKDPIWVKIADFGISKRVLDGETDLRTRAGTNGYVAPEVFGIGEVDEESSRYTSAVDIWSMGCLFYYILTKEPPFPDFATLQAYCDDEQSAFPEEKLLAQNVGTSGQSFIKKLLGVNPEARPKVTSLDVMTHWKIAGVLPMQPLSEPGSSCLPNSEPEFDQKVVESGASDQEEQMDYYTLQLWNGIKEDIGIRKIVALLEQGASPNKEHKAYTPFHLSAKLGSIEQMEMLLDYGADVNRKSRHADTPLHMATYSRDPGKVQLLINRGADVNAHDPDSEPILHHALTAGFGVDILNMLLRSNASVTAENQAGRTALHHAVYLYQEDKARLLLEHGANPNTRDLDGRTPLHSAVASDRISVDFIRHLVGIGADVTIEDNDRRTPLHEAVRHGRQEVIRFLAAQNPDYRMIHPELERPVKLALTGNRMLSWFRP